MGEVSFPLTLRPRHDGSQGAHRINKYVHQGKLLQESCETLRTSYLSPLTYNNTPCPSFISPLNSPSYLKRIWNRVFQGMGVRHNYLLTQRLIVVYKAITPVSIRIDEDALSVHLSVEPLAIIGGAVCIPVRSPGENPEPKRPKVEAVS